MTVSQFEVVARRALNGIEDKLQSLEWHRVNRTVNDEIFAGIIKAAIAEARAALAA